MNFQDKGYQSDYRVNILNSGKIISVEVTCCGKHIGEMRFKDGENKKCPICGTAHLVKIQHNHFHIRPNKPGVNESDALQDDNKPVALEDKAL